MAMMAELGRTMEGHADEVWSVCMSADGSRLFSGSEDNMIKVWDVPTGACVQTLEGHPYWVNSVCVSADGSRLFSGSDDNTIKVWDVATGACVQTLEGHTLPYWQPVPRRGNYFTYFIT